MSGQEVRRAADERPCVFDLIGSYGKTCASDIMLASLMMRSPMRRPNHGAALDRVHDWTRQRFKLTENEAIMVSEASCTIPGCPPLETVVVFWTGQRRHYFKISKPLADVVEDDLPPAFMKNALVALEGVDCDCC